MQVLHSVEKGGGRSIDIIVSFELACMQRMRARFPPPPTHTVSPISARASTFCPKFKVGV